MTSCLSSLIETEILLQLSDYLYYLYYIYFLLEMLEDSYITREIRSTRYQENIS